MYGGVRIWNGPVPSAAGRVFLVGWRTDVCGSSKMTAICASCHADAVASTWAGEGCASIIAEIALAATVVGLAVTIAAVATMLWRDWDWR